MLRNIRSTLVGSPVVAILLAALALLGVPGAAEPSAAEPSVISAPGEFSKTGSLAASRDRADAEPTPPPAPRVIRDGDSSFKRVGRPVDHPADACLTAWRLPASRVVASFNFPSLVAPRVVHRRIRHALVLRGPPSIA